MVCSKVSTIVIILIVLIVGIQIYNWTKLGKEPMIEGLNTFNGRMAVDDQYFYDKLFDDVYYYPNEYERNYESEEQIGKLIKTGWVRCKEECPSSGHCVEFGVSGAS